MLKMFLVLEWKTGKTFHVYDISDLSAKRYTVLSIIENVPIREVE